MSFVKYAGAAAALAASAMAQCSTDTTTIRSPADATGLGSCQTFTGAVAIATDAVGMLDFGSLGAIRGDFTANSPNVTIIQANSMQSMGRFELKSMQTLYTLSMQQLRSVDAIDWDGLAQLQQPDFGTGLSTVNDAISVVNTGIQDLSSMNIKQIMGDCRVSNNLQLTGLSWATTNMSSFTAAGNGPQQLNLSLPMLQTVTNDFDVRNASDVNIGSLSSVGGLLSIQSSNIQGLMLDNLTMAGSIIVANNMNLKNASFDMLNTTKGGLSLVNNDKLGGNLSFPALLNLGDLNITGAFDSVTIPKLNTIHGTCYLWSTQDIGSTCNQVNQWKSQGKIPGLLPAGPSVQNGVVCHTKSVSASAQGGTGTTGSSSGSSTTSSNAAPGNFYATPASLFGATGLLAAVLGLI